MRFLQKHNLNIARMAVVGAKPCEKNSDLFLAAAALLQAETLYFHGRNCVTRGIGCAPVSTRAISLQPVFLHRMAFGKTIYRRT